MLHCPNSQVILLHKIHAKFSISRSSEFVWLRENTQPSDRWNLTALMDNTTTQLSLLNMFRKGFILSKLFAVH